MYFFHVFFNYLSSLNPIQLIQGNEKSCHKGLAGTWFTGKLKTKKGEGCWKTRKQTKLTTVCYKSTAYS